MRRQIILTALPLGLVALVVAYVRMVAGERRVRRAGGAPTRPRAWRHVAIFGVAGLAIGAFVAWLSGLANHSDDLVASAVTGTFMLVPGLALGLGVGAGRWLGSRTVWRGRAKGLR